ncbi:MAG: hypothetical protein HYY03_09995 [Chloroflexi bacterium]|nr:hypothetical protein [Chloroflexota bacterium]
MRTVIALRLPLVVAAGAAALAALACAGSSTAPGIVAIAVNQDAAARPRLAFYAGVPGRDKFVLPAGNYELIAMEMGGGIASQTRPVSSGQDVAAATLGALRFPAVTEDAGRLNREAFRNLFLFFARFGEAQAGIDDVLAAGHPAAGPASPDELTATDILGEERPEGRLPGIRDWEDKMASWGRALELGLEGLQGLLPTESGAKGTAFVDLESLVREWRDGAAADRRAFLAVVGRFSAARRADLYQAIAAVFAEAESEGPDGFYARVEAGELDADMWAIANFAYVNDEPGAGGGPSYMKIARDSGLEPGRPYYERWQRGSASAWGFLWSVSVETAQRARLPAEALAMAGEPGAAAQSLGPGLPVEPP